jgi:hypothetical protein
MSAAVLLHRITSNELIAVADKFLTRRFFANVGG